MSAIYMNMPDTQVCFRTVAPQGAAVRAEGSQVLTRQLTRMSPAVDKAEAARLANAAYDGALQLRQQYRAAGTPQFHNFLVNAGLRRRGLCHHWARDLGGRLSTLKLRTLVLRWGIARASTLREHNAVVVTARPAV